MTASTISRRSFITVSAMLPFALRAGAAASVPVGLELYSVRGELKKDPEGTVRAVAQMGYQCVEFFSPYFEWTDAQAKQMKKLMDDLGIRCYSTHNDYNTVGAEKIQRVIDLNKILGTKYVVVPNSREKNDEAGWKKVADTLNAASEKLEPVGLEAGFHNHETEFTSIGTQRPMDILAKNTKKSVVLQLDIGTCLKAGADPVAWIKANPGRIRSIHCKDWSPDPAVDYKTLFGEGKADWKGIFAAAESVGGVEYYLVEQEGSRFSELETAKKCLEAFRNTHNG